MIEVLRLSVELRKSWLKGIVDSWVVRKVGSCLLVEWFLDFLSVENYFFEL